MNQSHRPLQLFIGILALSLLSIGCDIDSADSTSRSVSINVGGVYSGSPSTRIISRNSGAAITTLNVIQNGSGLQAVDNNGLIFRGNISTEFENGANFTLKGRTTAGQEGLITGTFTAGDSTVRMRGTWAEPSLFGTVDATANVSQSVDPDDGEEEETPEPTNGTSSASANDITLGITT